MTVRVYSLMFFMTLTVELIFEFLLYIFVILVVLSFLVIKDRSHSLLIGVSFVDVTLSVQS